jgi:hypothetical protein
LIAKAAKRRQQVFFQNVLPPLRGSRSVFSPAKRQPDRQQSDQHQGVLPGNASWPVALYLVATAGITLFSIWLADETVDYDMDDLGSRT